jgi:hypothetical protein
LDSVSRDTTTFAPVPRDVSRRTSVGSGKGKKLM